MTEITPARPDEPVLSGECIAYLTPEGKALARLIHLIDEEARWIVRHPYALADPATLPWDLFLMLYDEQPTRRWFEAHVWQGARR